MGYTYCQMGYTYCQMVTLTVKWVKLTVEWVTLTVKWAGSFTGIPFITNTLVLLLTAFYLLTAESKPLEITI